MLKPKILILHANGTNRDVEVAYAFELAGGQAEIVHLNQLRAKQKNWQDYQVLVVPGGFSYADTLGAGRLFALDLQVYFAEELQQFVSSGKPVIGICNGFQALIKTGVLPNMQATQTNTTLTFNQQGHFECRWVTLLPQSQQCLWTRDLQEPIYCPVAHGEGCFTVNDNKQLAELTAHDQIALVYADEQNQNAGAAYPANPNGSVNAIAGICNVAGNVLGLMPHPEDHVLPYQHPRWTRGEHGRFGLPLFMRGVQYVK